MAATKDDMNMGTSEKRSLQARIDAMYHRDRIWGIAFVIVLWVTYLFTFFSIAPLIEMDAKIALFIGGGLVLLYNTGSITAMLKQYLLHKQRVYEPDIRHLDEKRAARGKR